ncbi:MAG: deoxyribose-phosphate aldolase [Deltaproteobacteria bacterium]|nr:deoxyribose-phosphate aldolase [Deltaproteobacteria bacterium]
MLPFAIELTQEQLAPYIDHTLLRIDATDEDLKKICSEAISYGFASVCVYPANVSYCVAKLAQSSVKVVSVAGFPYGTQKTTTKTSEAHDAILKGAQEIDMVINIEALKNGDYKMVLNDIISVVDAANSHPVKVILETGALTNEQKIIGCALSKAAGAAFVKTSTGFGPGGATIEDVALMREIVGPDFGVKASGGIRTTEDARQMIMAGANRIGASASVAIVTNPDKKSCSQEY